MLQKVNEYFNEVVIGRVGKVERVIKDEQPTNRVRLSVVENWDAKEGVEPNWINITAFDKTADQVENIVKPGGIVTFFVKETEDGQYTNRTLNSFKIVVWPKKKEA